ncbi:MAG: helix-turn-helix domain-containing protein [Micromonosporaceae bacterium]
MAHAQSAPEAFRLAERLRDLREREFGRLTQGDLGRALGGGKPLSPATISMWETRGSGRVPPPDRLEAYAQLFCTPRSFEGEVRMLALSELTATERTRFEELKRELLRLRDSALSGLNQPALGVPKSMWHFPDGSRITLVSWRVPQERQPPHAKPGHINYERAAGLTDLDTLIDIYGAIRADNPTSRVVITAAEDLTQRDVANHLVLIGGRTWNTVTRWFSRIFPLPIDPGDPGDRGAIVVHEPGGGEREFKFTMDGEELVEDVGFFARGMNPSAPRRTLTICSGITTRGVHGVAQCFIDWEMRENNERYLIPRFPDGSTYCIVMRVPVVNGDPLTPDLSKEENRLFEWCDVSS